MPAVTATSEALTLTWVFAGSIVVELIVIGVALARAAWWLSGRFTAIDAAFVATARDIADLKADLDNDIAGRRAVAEAKTDLAQMRATLVEFRERIDRLEANEDGRKHA